MHKIAMPTEEGWEDYRQNLGQADKNLLCFTKEAHSYQDGTPSKIHFISVEQGNVMYIPGFLDLDMILAQAPEEIFLVGLSDQGRKNLQQNGSVADTLMEVIQEEYLLEYS